MAEVIALDFQLAKHGVQNGTIGFVHRAKVKIAIMAGLLAKGYVEVEGAHCSLKSFNVVPAYTH